MKFSLDNALTKALAGEGLSYVEGVEFTRTPISEIYGILAVTGKVREHFKGNEIDLCSIVNAKSGICAENCSFCSQSSHYETGVESYPMIEATDISGAAAKAEALGAREFSIVTSGTKVSGPEEIATLVSALTEMRAAGDMERCASIGNVSRDSLLRLKEAGLQSFHHNLETSRSFFPEVCTTHEYDEDIESIKAAKDLGLYVCSGGIFGLGEDWAQRVELAVTLRELGVDSVPINFLDPRPGTPLQDAKNLSPLECLKIIALFRLMLPATDIVVCGGRPKNLGHLQPLIFAAGANGMMIGNYLTTPGRDATDDLKMIEELGLKPRGH